MDADARVRARRIATLPDVPGFVELLDDLEAAEGRLWNRLTVETKAGAPVDQRAVDFARGVSDVIRKLRVGPERAARQLEKAEAEEAETGEE